MAAKHPRFWDELLECGEADPEGHIRAPVYPGHGIIYMRCDSDDYRLDFGRANQVVDRSERGSGSPLYRFIFGEMYHSLPEIDLAPDAHKASIDLPVDPGENVVLKFTDAAGKPLAGVETNGLRFAGPRSARKRGQSFVEGDSTTLYAGYPGENRVIWLRHRATGLTKLMQFSPQAGESRARSSWSRRPSLPAAW